MIDLTHIELATEEDKTHQLDQWARLFKATTWEELKMIAETNTAMQEAAQTLYELSSDWLVQDQCYAREEYNRYMRTYERAMKQKQQMEIKLAEQEVALADKDAALADKDAALADKDAEIARLKALLGNSAL